VTPPPADVAAGRLPRGATSRAPRRVSGPARRAGADSRRAPTIRARAHARSGLRARLRGVPDARLLDRLVRGRGWIAIVGVALIGIVFMQVSLLNLNAGISRAVTSAETLERQNATLRESIARLDTGERISDAAAEAGMVMPSAGEVTFLDARGADGRKAAAAVRPPKPVVPAATATGGAGAGAAATGTGAGAVAGAPGASAAAPGGAAATSGADAAATGAAATGATGAAATGAAATGTAAPVTTGSPGTAASGAAAGRGAPGGAAATSGTGTGTATAGGAAAGGAASGAPAAGGAAPGVPAAGTTAAASGG
jgi:cell division protein FtsL